MQYKLLIFLSAILVLHEILPTWGGDGSFMIQYQLNKLVSCEDDPPSMENPMKWNPIDRMILQGMITAYYTGHSERTTFDRDLDRLVDKYCPNGTQPPEKPWTLSPFG